MQRYDWKEAPIKPVRSLIYQEDRPKLPIKKENEFNYMSDFVWDQINENISKIESLVMMCRGTRTCTDCRNGQEHVPIR